MNKVLTEMKQDWEDCTRCDLAMTRTKMVFGEGNPYADVMLVAESPGEKEDLSGHPFMGRSGTLLMEFYLAISTDPRLEEMQKHKKEDNDTNDPFNPKLIREVMLEEVYVTNTIGCRPTSKGSQISDAWIMSCRPRLDEIIYQVDPYVIVALGRHALRTLVGKTVGVQKNMGNIFFSVTPGRTEVLEYPVVPIVHPAHFLRNYNPVEWKEGGMVFRARDALERAFWLADVLRHAYTGAPMRRDR